MTSALQIIGMPEIEQTRVMGILESRGTFQLDSKSAASAAYVPQGPTASVIYGGIKQPLMW